MGNIILRCSGLLPYLLDGGVCELLFIPIPVGVDMRKSNCMELKNYWVAANKRPLARLLKWVNLRPDESERTWIMFAFYTTISVGLRWAEDSTVALFLDEYGANPLPVMYIASAVVGAGIVVIYSWLQKIFPLRWVIVAIAPCMVIPLVLLVFLHRGIHVSYLTVIIVFLLVFLWH